MFGMKMKDAQGRFFDRKGVANKVDVATKRVLSKFGAYVRQTAKSSIRKRKSVSKPGDPPRSHSGLLKRFIFFGYDPRKRSVLIGPTKLNRSSISGAEALEHGGNIKLQPKKKEPAKRVKIEARPFMGPAFDKESPQLPQMWRDSVR